MPELNSLRFDFSFLYMITGLHQHHTKIMAYQFTSNLYFDWNLGRCCRGMSEANCFSDKAQYDKLETAQREFVQFIEEFKPRLARDIGF